MDREEAERYAREATQRASGPEGPDPELLANPDMSVLRMGVRPAPVFPITLLGREWAAWVSNAAEAAAAPVDYVALPLLATASCLIGNARWARATLSWAEPPHLWLGLVGHSGSSKSPGMACIIGSVLPVLEQRMQEGFPERLRDWRALAAEHEERTTAWKVEVKLAVKHGTPPPQPPADPPPPQPQSPRLRQSDVTVEKVASLLATTAPKGLLVVRDELAGWMLGLNTYNDAGRAFWLEAYGGGPYRVERQKLLDPIDVAHLVVAVIGGTQPDKLAEMFADADDGLLGRFVWAWPDPLPFRLGRQSPDPEFAIEALDRLRALEMMPKAESGQRLVPGFVSLSDDAAQAMEAFGRAMQQRQEMAGGLMQSAYGKARGLALRLSLVLEMLRWCGRVDATPLPDTIGVAAFNAACALVADYFMPMAERVYGDAAAPKGARHAAVLARWIVRERAAEVHVRHLQREVRLPGMGKAEDIHGAASVLMDAGWLLAPSAGEYQRRGREAYPVNPRALMLWEAGRRERAA